jgi:hypothetical protein
MKKKLTILSTLIIALFSINAKAQDAKTPIKSYLSFFGGVSNPTGNFAQSVYSNNSAGFAKSGVTLGLDGAVYVYKNLAIGVTFSFQDQGELNQTDVQNLANGYNTSFTKDQTVVTAVNRYHNINLMAGPQYSFVYKDFTLDLRAAAGIIKSTSTPSTSVVFDNSTNPSEVLHQLNSKAFTLAYGGSAGLRYSLSDTWDVGIKGNYINSEGIKISNSNNPGTTGRFVTNQPISEFQTTLGIALKF